MEVVSVGSEPKIIYETIFKNVQLDQGFLICACELSCSDTNGYSCHSLFS